MGRIIVGGERSLSKGFELVVWSVLFARGMRPSVIPCETKSLVEMVPAFETKRLR